MNKRMIIAIAVLVASTAWAGDTVVNTDLFGPGAGVNMSFNVSSGTFNATTQSFDTSTWHPGQIGSTNTFYGSGTFAGTYNVSGGNYGNLSSFINASGNALLQMTEAANLDVLSANHIYGLEANFSAIAAGTNAEMNLKSIAWGASPGGWQEATNPWSAPPLQGQWIQKQLMLEKNDVAIAGLLLDVSTDGTATMSNSNIWGWGVKENGGAGQATTHYSSSATQSVSATGAGILTQSAFGVNSLTFQCDYIMPGGGNVGGGMWDFYNGISGTYKMVGN